MLKANQLKTEGMALAATGHEKAIGIARNCAILLAVRHGEVWVDKVRDWMAKGSDVTREALAELDAHPAVWGTVVKTPKLKFTGRITESNKVSRHCGSQRIWRYET